MQPKANDKVIFVDACNIFRFSVCVFCALLGVTAAECPQTVAAAVTKSE